jgi:hypothetical protein
MATGYFHRKNNLAYRILVVFVGKKSACTTKDIADSTHIDEHKISATISYWIKNKNHYLIRQKQKITVPERKRWYYQYVLSDEGLQHLQDMSRRLKAGESLDMKADSKRKRKEPIGINKYGKIAGLTQEEAYKLSGLD